MSEVMTVETIIEAEWLLKNYWTKMRFAYRPHGHGWSDVDVLAYHPEKKNLVIAESKVRGPKKSILAYTEDTKASRGTILKSSGYPKKNTYFLFLQNLPKICEDGVVFNNFGKMVKTLTVQHVSNYVIAEDLKDEACKSVRQAALKQLKKCRTRLPSNLEVKVELDSTLDVIARIIELENDHQQGRRYGHPVLDIAREINRYVHPKVNRAGRGKARTEPVKDQAVKQFAEAIGMVRYELK